MSYDDLFLGQIYQPPDNGEESNNLEVVLNRYIEKELSPAPPSQTAIYSLPKHFNNKTGEIQAKRAEKIVFDRLHGVGQIKNSTFWMTFFHGTVYAGRSQRNLRNGRLIFREHDFVAFIKHNDDHYVVLMEVKSTNDVNTICDNIEKTSFSRMIKNNKRTALHQLRDHQEILKGILNEDLENIQSYVMWPFLGCMTQNSSQNLIKRWQEDGDLHCFQDTLSNQLKFNSWFLRIVLGKHPMKESIFNVLLHRFIVLSAGVRVNEINKNMLALLNVEQWQLLNGDFDMVRKGPVVVHGVAGTGKSLLILRKLEQLFQQGLLDEHNRALYICYWPGIRCQFEENLRKLGLSSYVDTARFFIASNEFSTKKMKNYKHIFMDETEAIFLCFHKSILEGTLARIYNLFHCGNCFEDTCPFRKTSNFHDLFERHPKKITGELWLMVDINQATIFLPSFHHELFRKATVTLSKVMRCSNNIFDFFKDFYYNPTKLTISLKDMMNIPNITAGHQIKGPPIYWTDLGKSSNSTTAKLIIDLCSTKGFQPNDICLIPFFFKEKFDVDSLNQEITKHFAENGFKPKAVKHVEDFIKNPQHTDFLVAWALRVKGLEFKVIIIVVEEEEFDSNDCEDRKKIYICSSRCTSLLIIISDQNTLVNMKLNEVSTKYQFHLSFDPDADD